eukprot:TRINITY_DN49278_c0_g1_i2.p1 TRINITY_DN49278_c0_g1~~TRINITY_DN49278_c0_g1_i2.p1  ORF type:complete len:886 (+),score=216.87 TRINITY_DN49278_c0_g1_i2:176-2833(+)
MSGTRVVVVDREGSVETVGTTMTFGSEAANLEEASERTALLAAGTAAREPEGAACGCLRRCLEHQATVLFMLLLIVIVLFLPDVFVVLGVNSNFELDVILTFAMAAFVLELIVVLVLDPSYALTFFFPMDVIGTASLALDISFLSGVDVTVPRFEPALSAAFSSSRAEITARMTRAARLGARAGRLTRVVRVFRQLSCLQPAGAKSVSVASFISRTLQTLLQTRLGLLAIVLMMAIPLLHTMSFPQENMSPQAWVQRLDARAKKGQSVDSIIPDLHRMVDFYAARNHGPFRACFGKEDDDGFLCEKHIDGWSPTYDRPQRGSSALWVHTDRLMVAFNMEAPKTLDASLAMTQIAIVVTVMILSGVALSRVVRELAVVPLENMMSTVQNIASTVFKFGWMSADARAAREQEFGEEDSIDSSKEMMLLEKIVQKLATVVELQTRQQVVQPTDNMEEEDLAIINMIQGNVLQQEGELEKALLLDPRKAPMEAGTRSSGLRNGLTLDACGLKQKDVDSYGFNCLDLTTSVKSALAVYLISAFHGVDKAFIQSSEDETILKAFVHGLQEQYQTNPFHNFDHAVDVCHGTERMLRICETAQYFSPLEQFGMLIAAIAHDVGHPGVNNIFLSETSHDLAMTYNDKSPLENMHASLLYKIVCTPETNIFVKLSKDQFKESRKNIIEAILHTDMTNHAPMVKELQMLYQMNTEIFDTAGSVSKRDSVESGRRGASLQSMKTEDVQLSAAAVNVFSRPEVKTLAMNCMLHSADVSNPCREWQTTKAWAMCLLDEFFAQGDLEKSLGIPVQFLNDRDKLNRPNSQIGFIEFMIAPFFVHQIRLWPALHVYVQHLAHNIVQWETLWLDGCNASPEERQKVRSRVEAVKTSLEHPWAS